VLARSFGFLKVTISVQRKSAHLNIHEIIAGKFHSLDEAMWPEAMIAIQQVLFIF